MGSLSRFEQTGLERFRTFSLYPNREISVQKRKQPNGGPSFMQLEIKNLSKQYKGGVWGLKDFSLTLRPGILGLLGPNGAGKSTLMRILATVTKPTEGSVIWNGHDIGREPDILREQLGYLPQDFGVYPHLTAQEFLEYLAAAKGLHGAVAKRRIEELLLLVNLQEARKRQVGGFSGGMRQRVGIAAALLNDPKLLIVDEPTAGLDPEERVRFRNLLSDFSGERIVILSTHIVSDVESIATGITLIQKGKHLVSAPPEELLSRADGKVWEMSITADELPSLRQKYLVTAVVRRSEGLRVRLVSDVSPGNAAQTVMPSLEDIYLWYIAFDRERAAA